jgi:small neutral amino acid transporter SnatA (MarC family)
MIFQWITLPTASELISSVGQYTGAIFVELLPIALAITGLFIGVLFVRFLGKSVLNAIQRLTGRGRAPARRTVRRV